MEKTNYAVKNRNTQLGLKTAPPDKIESKIQGQDSKMVLNK